MSNIAQHIPETGADSTQQRCETIQNTTEH